MNIKHTLMAAGALVLATGSAHAGVVEELRVGVMQHNICVTNCKNADKEDGPSVNLELVFASPDFLSWAFEPRPYLMASINTAGDTSFGGGGLEWAFNVTDSITIEPGLGYVIHNGETSNPFPDGTPQAYDFAQENLLLGSEDLFRTSLGVHWQFSEKWGAEVLYEHLSHGQILGSGRNQGVDNIGMRISYTFGE